MIQLNDWKYEEKYPSITAYTTTFNCVKGNYPVERSIKSFAWADKIIVVDGGSTDGTLDVLNSLKNSLPEGKMDIIEMPIDESNPGKDGFQKAMAFAMCSTEFAVQFDIDEICVGKSSKWKSIVKKIPNSVDILCLPVFEPHGAVENVRFNKEHTPWKWRIYRVKPEITHGIPSSDKMEIDGVIYSRGGSDGCFPVHIVTGEMFPSILNEVAKRMVDIKNTGNIYEYEKFVNEIIESQEIGVWHLGHVNLEHKIKHYLTSWHSWWCGLYNKDPKDPANNVYFPGVDIDKVSDKMIEKKVDEKIKNTQVVYLKKSPYVESEC